MPPLRLVGQEIAGNLAADTMVKRIDLRSTAEVHHGQTPTRPEAACKVVECRRLVAEMWKTVKAQGQIELREPRLSRHTSARRNSVGIPLARACRSISGEKSTPTTRPGRTCSASQPVNWPVPHPTSNTHWPAAPADAARRGHQVERLGKRGPRAIPSFGLSVEKGNPWIGPSNRVFTSVHWIRTQIRFCCGKPLVPFGVAFALLRSEVEIRPDRSVILSAAKRPDSGIRARFFGCSE